MIGYIYRTTNNVNGKIYIGRRISPRFQPCYFGSGTVLKHALVKHGKNNFKVEMIAEGETRDELNVMEKNTIAILRESLGIKQLYNVSDGGDGGGGNRGHRMSEENKARFRLLALGRKHTDETRRRISEIVRSLGKDIVSHWKGKTLSESHRRNLSISKTGIRPSEETRKRISDGRKGRVILMETRRKLSLAGMGERNHNFGKRPSAETLNRLSESQKARHQKLRQGVV